MTLPQKSSLEWIKLHSLRNVLFLFCSCWLQRQLVDFHWLQLKGWSWWIEHFTGRNSVFEVCRPKRCLFHLKSDYQSILTFGLLISHLQSLSVAGEADSQRSALQWTKACYVKEMSSEQRYDLMRRCWTHPLCSSSTSRTAATTKSEISPENTFSARDLNTHLH